ncbi:cytochrome c oxidase assembly [Pyrrhoderma noxium]|uniref:Cytochrome c oxidase assembly n=1 Tax=Pyrrhoderma noxium TaxID=2282107 RepID=A0A286UJD7_9AGAM|nr:cytochrome c oxidase assembly [Pyrrhoderma noxium]
MSRAARVTLAASFVLAAGTIFGVHYLQNAERETMFKGVLRDDERRKEKMLQREAELRESQRKREFSRGYK